jgi:hypothetical protein
VHLQAGGACGGRCPLGHELLATQYGLLTYSGLCIDLVMHFRDRLSLVPNEHKGICDVVIVQSIARNAVNRDVDHISMVTSQTLEWQPTACELRASE